ncbi:MAG: hypothetical protein J0L75_18040 [Spirochaetes bacterium]|nr:hypothetical protein [Spirochaetota bacterium]
MSALALRASAWSWRLPLAAPFPVGRKSIDERSGFLIRLEDSEGHHGYGEVAPLPGFSAEDPADVARELPHILARLERFPLADFDSFPRLDLAPGAIRLALECALVQWAAAKRGLAPQALLGGGGAWAGGIPVAVLLQAGQREFGERLMGRMGEGYRNFKIKIGGDSETEQRAIRELAPRIHEYMAEATDLGPPRFRIDANRSINPEELAGWKNVLQQAGLLVDFFEEPTPTFPEEIPLEIPLAMDETLLDAVRTDSWGKYVPAGVRALVVKPSCFPSIEKLDALCRFARDRHIDLVASSALDTDLGVAAWLPVVLAWFHRGGRLPALGLDPLRWFREGLLGEETPRIAPLMEIRDFAIHPAALRQNVLKPVYPAA